GFLSASSAWSSRSDALGPGDAGTLISGSGAAAWGALGRTSGCGDASPGSVRMCSGAGGGFSGVRSSPARSPPVGHTISTTAAMIAITASTITTTGQLRQLDGAGSARDAPVVHAPLVSPRALGRSGAGSGAAGGIAACAVARPLL